MRILLVDEAGDLMNRMIVDIESGYVVDVAHDDLEGSYLSEVNEYDAIIVGPTLSYEKAIEVCRKTRDFNVEVPILFIPKECNVDNRLKALDSGADVCINHSINTSEIKAQLKAFERKKAGVKNFEIRARNTILNLKEKQVKINGKKVNLRRKEFDLLEYLFINKGRVVSKEELLEHVWDNGIYVFSNTVEVHILTIRKRLKKYLAKAFIKTVRGFGYIVEG